MRLLDGVRKGIWIMSTEPMTPPECDLRGLSFMPLDLVRLIDSDLYALSSGDEFKAAVTLWARSWLQVPAASLPDDDRVLAHLSGAGSKWRKVKAMALRGFVKCSDGRLYHPVVAEKAREAWAHRLKQREKANRRWQDRGNAAADAAARATGYAAANAVASDRSGAEGREPAPEQRSRSAKTQPHLRDANALQNLATSAPAEISQSEHGGHRSAGNATAYPPAMQGTGTGTGTEDSSNQDRTITRSASRGAGYAFEGAVIRLNQRDFDKWTGTFSAIPDLAAELTSLDAWLSEQPADQQKRWFHVTAGALAKKHQARLEERKRGGSMGGYVPMGPAGG
jgi:hypothetical protein